MTAAPRPAIAGDVREASQSSAEAVCRLVVRPHRPESATWRTVPWRGASPRSPRYRPRRGTSGAVVPRPRAGFPRRTPDCSGAPGLSRLPGFPGTRRIATATPNCFDAPRWSWTSAWPRRRRRGTATTWGAPYSRHQRITSAAFLAAPAAAGSAPRFSAPSLPESTKSRLLRTATAMPARSAGSDRARPRGL